MRMNTLTSARLQDLTQRISARKIRLLEEIRAVLARSGNEHYADLVGEAGDAGDASVASLLRDVAEAEVRRDVLELRDVVAAQGRLAAGSYGVCIDCNAAIGYPRLAAYPTAKRCIECQQQRERSGHYGPRPSL
jgi:RNA polymerase-binding transcription factor DksA